MLSYVVLCCAVLWGVMWSSCTALCCGSGAWVCLGLQQKLMLGPRSVNTLSVLLGQPLGTRYTRSSQLNSIRFLWVGIWWLTMCMCMCMACSSIVYPMAPGHGLTLALMAYKVIYSWYNVYPLLHCIMMAWLKGLAWYKALLCTQCSACLTTVMCQKWLYWHNDYIHT